MYRLAVFDIGTNSILLTIVEVQGGEIRSLCERSRITRLGEGLNKTGILGEIPQQRSLDALKHLLDEVRDYRADFTIAAGTEVLRRAGNAQVFLQACEQMGLHVEVISGEREAYLSYLSVAKDPLFAGYTHLTMLDVGGGSTEISRGHNGSLTRSHSYPLGAVRLTEALLHTDPPTTDEIHHLQEEVRAHLRDEPPLQTGEYLVGVGGTFVNLASLHGQYTDFLPDRVHGAVLTAEQVQALANLLCALPLEERRRLPGIEPERAPVLHTGACIVHAVMQCLGAHQLAVSMRGLRWGLIYEFAASHRD
ncbi:MAG: Ppx/GppA family phosphatase [Chthonomonadetes bacterium]|nr:Ppx/GppA family phosphatase [Chthonomonadetes bacterium]